MIATAIDPRSAPSVADAPIRTFRLTVQSAGDVSGHRFCCLENASRASSAAMNSVHRILRLTVGLTSPQTFVAPANCSVRVRDFRKAAVIAEPILGTSVAPRFAVFASKRRIEWRWQ